MQKKSDIDVKNEIRMNFEKLAELHARVSDIEREDKNDPPPHRPTCTGRHNWGNQLPEDYDGCTCGSESSYDEEVKDYRARCTERSKKSRKIHEKAGEISQWLWENSAGNIGEFFEGLDAYYRGVDEHAIRNGELAKLHFWRPRPKNCEEIQMLLPPPGSGLCANPVLDDVDLLVDFGLNKEYHESARTQALRQVNSMDGVPDLDSIVRRVINEDMSFSSIFWFSSDPRVIIPFFEYPAIVEKWAKREETRCTQYPFVSMGAKAIPSLLEVMESDEFGHAARHYTAALIGEIDDKENEQKMLEMMLGGDVEYASRALMRSKDPEKVHLFFSMWDEIDEEDWLNALSIPEAVPEAARTAADKDADSRLRERCVELLLYFPKYEWRREFKSEYGGGMPLVPEVGINEYRKIWGCFVNGDYPEGIGFETLALHAYSGDMPAYKGFVDAYDIAKDQGQDPSQRIRMIKAIAGNMKHLSYSNLNYCGMYDFDPLGYFRKIGSRLWGWRREPNPDVRKAAREVLR